jgi:DedD protein
MRFEIKAGGAFLIFVGLVGLSGGVFALGLVAGSYMARQNQPDLNQISSTYPLPSPSEKPAPVSEMSPAAAPSQSVASAPIPPVAPIKPPAPAIGEEPPAAVPSPATVARLKPAPEAPAVNRPAPDENDTDDDSDTASSPAESVKPLPLGARPYNIQIEAVMDKSGADEMVSRLKTLGYNAQEVKVALNGQTWYRVHVGPYASAEDATAAQNRLREQYKQAYTTSH